MKRRKKWAPSPELASYLDLAAIAAVVFMSFFNQ